MDHVHNHHNHAAASEFVSESTTTPKTISTNFANTAVTNPPVDVGNVYQHSHDHEQGHQMSMFFHGGCKEVVLFSFWQIESSFGIFNSFILIFLMGTLYEGIKWFRVYFDLWTADATSKAFSGCLSMSSFSKAKRQQRQGVEDALIQKTIGATSQDSNCHGDCAVVAENSTGNALTHEVYAPTVIVSTPVGAGTPINRWTWIMMYVSREFSPSTCKLIETVIYAVQLTLAYWLMLIAMTFNIWLTAAVVLGAAFGHWVFANIKFAPPGQCFCSTCSNAAAGPEQMDNFASDACH